MIRIPDAYVRVIREREEDAGSRWIDALPALIEDLCTAWGCVVDGAPLHGQIGIVVPVLRAGEPAALKVSFPHPGNVSEGPGLRAFDGRGAVRLHEEEPERFALLLERAGPATPTSVMTVDEWLDLAGELARTLAVSAPPDTPSLAGTAAGWRDQLDGQVAEAPGVVSAAALARARETIDVVALDDTPTLTHGDLHEGNVLRATRMPWLVIDPKGWRGTAAHEAYTVAIARLDALEAAPDPAAEVLRRIRRFAVAAGLDPELCREVAYARAVSSLLHETLGGGAVSGRTLLKRVVEAL